MKPTWPRGLFHPHIVGIHDRGEFDRQLWISMDYVDGHIVTADPQILLKEGTR